MDDWTTAAATDDALVANLLLRLKHSGRTRTATTTMRAEMKSTAAASSSGGVVPFRWGRRKARSRPDFTGFAMRKERATRSPTTPLSWSGGCGTTSVSGSGNVDGFEASSMMCRRFTGSRSKITVAASHELVNSKQAKRKKTYNELKKEECLLVDERLNLKRDLANMHATLNHHKMTNQNLKRIKSMNLHSREMTTAVADRPFVCVPMQTITSMIQDPTLVIKAQDSKNEIPHPKPPSSSGNFQEAKDKKSFMLPDLNMLPTTDS